MSSNLVSMTNLDTILKAIKLGVVTKINARDITQAQKDILTKANMIDTTTNNSGFLADNGTYITIDTTKINDINTKTQVVMDLFKISYTNDAWDTSVTITLPTARSYFTSQVYNGKIYCIGGWNGVSVSNSVYIYDIAGNTWTAGTAMPTSRYCLTSQLYNGKIYCIGGYSTSYSNIVEIYDIAGNTWTAGTIMPTARQELTSQIYIGKIYCIGGVNGSVSNKVEIYDIAGNTWTAGTAMPTARYGLTSQIYNGKIYCIGGQINTTTATNIVEIYDIAGNTWTAGTIMPTARQELTSQIYNGKIYCIGGQINTTTATNIVEIYNIITGAWTTSILPLPIAKYGLTSVQNNGKVYYIGGYTTTVTNTVDVLTLGVDNYTLTLPTDLQAKLDLIVDTGDGTKVLADNGTFIDIPLGYRFMTDTEVTSMVTTVNAYTG